MIYISFNHIFYIKGLLNPFEIHSFDHQIGKGLKLHNFIDCP